MLAQADAESEYAKVQGFNKKLHPCIIDACMRGQP